MRAKTVRVELEGLCVMTAPRLCTGSVRKRRPYQDDPRATLGDRR